MTPFGCAERPQRGAACRDLADFTADFDPAFLDAAFLFECSGATYASHRPAPHPLAAPTIADSSAYTAEICSAYTAEICSAPNSGPEARRAEQRLKRLHRKAIYRQRLSWPNAIAIRYAKRKANADLRPRIGGRFVKTFGPGSKIPQCL
jgi:hypothetical protein